jgi:hypothetical protein
VRKWVVTYGITVLVETVSWYYSCMKRQGLWNRRFEICGISTALYHTEESVLLVKKLQVWTITIVIICAVILWNLTTSRNFVLHCHLFVNLSFKCELNIFSLNLLSKIFVQLTVQKIRYIRNTRILGCCLVAHSCVNCRHFPQTHTLFSCSANSSWWLLHYVPFYYTWAQNTLCQHLFQAGDKKLKL